MLYWNVTIVTYWLQNYFNITNYNFYDVDVVALSVIMYYQQSIIATEVNGTRLTLPMKSTRLHYVTMNATFHKPDYMM